MDKKLFKVLDKIEDTVLIAMFVAMVGINGVIEAIACCVLGGAISRALYAIGIKRA